jgi:hypothetical protein
VHEGAPPVAAVLEGAQREDAVGADVLAVAEGDHVVSHLRQWFSGTDPWTG